MTLEPELKTFGSNVCSACFDPNPFAASPARRIGLYLKYASHSQMTFQSGVYWRHGSAIIAVTISALRLFFSRRAHRCAICSSEFVKEI